MSTGCGECPKCSGCNEKIGLNHGGIACAQGHNLCLNGCAAQFVQIILNEPQVYLPPRCPDCRVELNLNIVERIMTTNQIQQFHTTMFELVWAKQVVGSNEVLCQCPFCNFAEIRQTDQKSVMFVFCRQESCKKITCFVCKTEVFDTEIDSDNEYLDDFQVENLDKGLKYHMKCVELASFKERFEKIIENSTGIQCPGCAIVGRKDDACNHMTCVNCETEWCYFCGKKILNEDNGSVYDHFDNWRYNNSHCPLYLYNISEIDDSWPEDGEAVIDYFHRQRTLRLLNKFYHECGAAKWEEISGHFKTIRSCGFTKDEFLNVPSDAPMFVDNYSSSEDDGLSDFLLT